MRNALANGRGIRREPGRPVIQRGRSPGASKRRGRIASGAWARDYGALAAVGGSHHDGRRQSRLPHAGASRSDATSQRVGRRARDPTRWSRVSLPGSALGTLRRRRFTLGTAAMPRRSGGRNRPSVTATLSDRNTKLRARGRPGPLAHSPRAGAAVPSDQSIGRDGDGDGVPTHLSLAVLHIPQQKGQNDQVPCTGTDLALPSGHGSTNRRPLQPPVLLSEGDRRELMGVY